MKKLAYLIIGMAVGIVATITVKTNDTYVLDGLEYANYKTLDYKIELIKAHNKYYNAAECLLGTLNFESNWVNSYDAQYYYEAREKLDSLYNLEDTAL